MQRRCPYDADPAVRLRYAAVSGCKAAAATVRNRLLLRLYAIACRMIRMSPLRLLPLSALLLLLTAGLARAELPAVPDPAAWSALPPAQRETEARALRERLKSATPEQRRQFRERLRERMSSLPPEQRREIGERLREDWKSMNDQERERLRAERRAYVQSLSPDERRALLRERREMLERMSPEERRRLKRELEH